MRAAVSECLGANSPDNMITDAGTEGDRRGRGGAVSTPHRLSPKGAAATLLTALLAVRGRTSKKAVGTGWEPAQPLSEKEQRRRCSSLSRSRILAVDGEAPSTRRYRTLDGTTIRPFGRLCFPCEERPQQATERLGGVMNQLPAPSASTAGGASGCFSVRLACRGPVLESLRAARPAVVFHRPVPYCLTRIIGGISCRAIR